MKKTAFLKRLLSVATASMLLASGLQYAVHGVG